jgi:hypothetical protein
MSVMQTLKEIALLHAKKQPGMVDALLEEAPVLAVCRWVPASHGLWNVAEEVKDVTGPGFVDMNAALPMMTVSTDLRRVDLAIMGGLMQVPQDKADQYGGPDKYFAKAQGRVLKKAGNDTESYLYYQNWTAFARDNGKLADAGADAGGTSSIMVVRFDPDANTGLYDPTQFDKGTLLRITPLNSGAIHTLQNAPYVGVPGYAVMLKGRFGWQILNPKCVAGIVNINAGHVPTANMIDDAIADARGTPENTYIFCHTKTKNLCMNPEKHDSVRSVDDKKIERRVDAWNGIRIIDSYNIRFGGETVTVF